MRATIKIAWNWKIPKVTRKGLSVSGFVSSTVSAKLSYSTSRAMGKSKAYTVVGTLYVIAT